MILGKLACRARHPIPECSCSRTALLWSREVTQLSSLKYRSFKQYLETLTQFLMKKTTHWFTVWPRFFSVFIFLVTQETKNAKALAKWPFMPTAQRCTETDSSSYICTCLKPVSKVRLPSVFKVFISGQFCFEEPEINSVFQQNDNGYVFQTGVCV